MKDVLLIRLEAPLMSFGGPAVDNHRVTMLFPGRALLTGLLGNALGYTRVEFDPLERLQRRLEYAVRRDRAGTQLVDYQTVDLSQAHMQAGWTTWGHLEGRGGGNAQETHIRYRHFLADAAYTVALAVAPDMGGPTLDALEQALREPARPLYIGRKCCIPTGHLLQGRASAENLSQAVQYAKPNRRSLDAHVLAWWPNEASEPAGQQLVAVTDDLDWANQKHVGRRFMREGGWPREVIYE